MTPLTPAVSGFDALLQQSRAEGHRMLLRFAENWQSGDNLFDRTGECIFGVWLDDTLMGVCGRNIDPYDPAPRAGRVRHLYVALAARGTGLGQRLIDAIVADAAPYFDYLNTNAPETAYPFYEHVGFKRLSDVAHVTHRLTLVNEIAPLVLP